MVHVSNIQQGARANSAADLLSRGQRVKVKVMSVAYSASELTICLYPLVADGSSGETTLPEIPGVHRVDAIHPVWQRI